MPTAATRRVSAVDSTPVDDTVQDDVPTVGEVDVNALIAQLQEQARIQAEVLAQQKAHIDTLLAEKGIPSDPVAAQVVALQSHVNAQANANPWHSESYDALKSYVDKLGTDGHEVTDKRAQKALRLVQAVQAKHPGHELAYTRQLADDLYTLMLDPEDD